MTDVSEGGKARACWSYTVSPSRQAGLRRGAAKPTTRSLVNMPARYAWRTFNRCRHRPGCLSALGLVMLCKVSVIQARSTYASGIASDRHARFGRPRRAAG